MKTWWGQGCATPHILHIDMQWKSKCPGYFIRRETGAPRTNSTRRWMCPTGGVKAAPGEWCWWWWWTSSPCLEYLLYLLSYLVRVAVNISTLCGQNAKFPRYEGICNLFSVVWIHVVSQIFIDDPDESAASISTHPKDRQDAHMHHITTLTRKKPSCFCVKTQVIHARARTHTHTHTRYHFA
jgi:hypothetical protein